MSGSGNQWGTTVVMRDRRPVIGKCEGAESTSRLMENLQSPPAAAREHTTNWRGSAAVARFIEIYRAEPVVAGRSSCCSSARFGEPGCTLLGKAARISFTASASEV